MTINGTQIYNANTRDGWRAIVFGDADETITINSTVVFSGGVQIPVETFTGSLKSVTGIATPAALTATQFTGFASTVSGAVLMGYGTTGDVTLKNRAGTDVLVIGPNSTVVTLPGSLVVNGGTGGQTVSIGGTLHASGAVTFDSTVGMGALTATTGTFSAGSTSKALQIDSTNASGVYAAWSDSGSIFGYIGSAGGLDGGTAGDLTIRSDGASLGLGISAVRKINITSTLVNVVPDFSVATSKFTVASASGNTVVAGTVQMSHYGAGSATFDASGNITSVSDERHKTDIRPFTRGLSDLLGLKPITYKFNALSGLETAHDYSGFSAQNVQAFIPEAVMVGADGILSFSDRPVLAACVNAIQSLDDRLKRLEQRAA